MTALVLASAALVACGGSSDGDETADAGDAVSDDGSVGTPTDADNSGDTDSGDTGGAGATVEIDGATYQFRPLETDPDEYIHTYCRVVADSLQGGMLLVDDTGARVEGGTLDFILLEPGGIYENTGDPAELMIELPSHEGVSFVAEEIDAPASGSTASGTFTASNGIGGTLSGTIEANC